MEFLVIKAAIKKIKMKQFLKTIKSWGLK